MAHPPDNLFLDRGYLRDTRIPPFTKTDVSIVICSLGRSESLDDTLESLSHQTFKSFEVILITEKGDLSELRQRGLKASCGDIVSFIDDDVYCEPTWLESVVKVFKERKEVVGVSGQTTIEDEYKGNRDCLKFEKLRKIQEWLFKVSSKPGHLSICGAPSMVSNFEGCKYNGEVQYLECCNMSVRRKEALDVGGFDEVYIRTGEWSEPDLSLKLGKVGKLIFSPNVKLNHRPSQQGVYKARLETDHRWRNFMEFQRKWVTPGLRTYAYRAFIWTYLKMKELRMI